MSEIKINYAAFDEANEYQKLTTETMKRMLSEQRTLFSDLSSVWEGVSGEAYTIAAENILKCFYTSMETFERIQNNTFYTKMRFMEEDKNLSSMFQGNEVKP